MASNDEKHPAWLYIYLAVITIVTRANETDTHHETNHEGDQYDDDQCLVVDEHLNLL
jgi:hypothetical protein